MWDFLNYFLLIYLIYLIFENAFLKQNVLLISFHFIFTERSFALLFFYFNPYFIINILLKFNQDNEKKL